MESVDDIPVLIGKLERMRVRELADQHFKPHGNWQGCSVGQVVEVWLAYVLSEGDHRLSQVQEWVKNRVKTLSFSLKTEVRPEDFSDDRLAIVLDLFSKDEAWRLFECDMTQGVIRIYDLKGNLVRLDSTTGSGYWRVDENGLFQLGHSKDHRPDLPQFKVMLATLDPLYIPAIDQARTNLGRSGLLYVGDCKIMSFETRLHVAAGGDYYLGPFSNVQITNEALTKLLEPVWSGQQALIPVQRNGIEIAEGFETSPKLVGKQGDKEIEWIERRLVVRSMQYVKSANGYS